MPARRKIRRSRKSKKSYARRASKTLVTATATIKRGKMASLYKKRKSSKRRIKRRGGKKKGAKKTSRQ